MDKLMVEPPAAVLLEEGQAHDLMSWAWRRSPPRRPAVGYLSKAKELRRYRQSKEYRFVTWEDLRMRALKILLGHIVDGAPLRSATIGPRIPGADGDDGEFFQNDNS